MARGATLAALLTDLRAEMRLSINPAHNVQVRDQQVYALQRVQDGLYDKFTWPHLKVYRYFVPTADVRYYDITGCLKQDNTGALVAADDMKIDRVLAMWVRDGSIWRSMSPGIDERNFNQWNSETGETSWPPERWAVAEGDQIEIWPVPSTTGSSADQIDIIRVHGIRNLAPLIDDTDTADLDDHLLVLSAAAELMSGEDSEKKSRLAKQRLDSIRGNATKSRRFGLYSDLAPKPLLRGPPTVSYRVV